MLGRIHSHPGWQAGSPLVAPTWMVVARDPPCASPSPTSTSLLFHGPEVAAALQEAVLVGTRAQQGAPLEAQSGEPFLPGVGRGRYRIQLALRGMALGWCSRFPVTTSFPAALTATAGSSAMPWKCVWSGTAYQPFQDFLRLPLRHQRKNIFTYHHQQQQQEPEVPPILERFPGLSLSQISGGRNRLREVK